VPTPGTATVPAPARAELADRVLFEDKRLLVIDKPAGMAVHGGSGLSFGVIEALRAERPDAHFLELVHRLDRDTSGCLMIAKKRSELRTLHELLRNGRIVKQYLLLVKGRWNPAVRRVDAPLKKNQRQGGERVVRVDDTGKTAVTRFRLLQDFATATLLEAELETGRTHQIRVHAAHAGHPIAGDTRYGDAEFNAHIRKLGLKRLFLHAHYLSFRDAEQNRAVEVSAPLADELSDLLNRLES
jgi:23S rRNA pseudouridine955/2504/2580 synthase